MTENNTSLKRKFDDSPTKTSSKERTGTFTDNDDILWTRHHWRKLEEWYMQEDRDYVKAAEAYYDHHCTQAEETWTLAQLTNKSRCLDTFAKAHDNLLPSELQQKRRENNLCLPSTPPPQSTPNLTPQSTPTRPITVNKEKRMLVRSPVRDWSPCATMEGNKPPLASPRRFKRENNLDRTLSRVDSLLRQNSFSEGMPQAKYSKRNPSEMSLS